MEDVALYFEHFSGELPNFVTRVKGHGRIEKRDYHLLTDLPWLPQRTQWSGPQTVGMVTATISRNDKITTDALYFLSSVTDVERFAYAVRKHWSIENQLHWCLDVIFDGDTSRARKDMSPLNLNVLSKTAWCSARMLILAKGSVSRKNALLPPSIPCAFLISFSANFKCCCPDSMGNISKYDVLPISGYK